LVAVKDILQGDDAFERATHSAVRDWEQRPSLEVRQGARERKIGEEDGCSFWSEMFL
jgi:hypothetical protein